MSVFDGQQYIGLIPTINVLCGELFPTKIRATANGIVMATTYIAFMVNLKIYPIAVAAFAFHYVMYFYAAMMAFMVVWGGLTIKYTDKLSLTEIQDMHEKNEGSGQVLNDGICHVNTIEVTELGDLTTEGNGRQRQMREMREREETISTCL